MKPLQFLRLPLASLFIFSLVGIAADEQDLGQIQISVGKLLEQGHYSRTRLDDKVSRELLKNYLDNLDYNHLFLTQEDIAGFTAKYGSTLDDDILLGNSEPAFQIYNVYKKRVEERVAKVKVLLGQEFTFSSDRSIKINRQKVPWPKDIAEADALWRDRLEGEMLQEKLNKQKVDPPVKVLTRRYDQLLRNLNEQSREDVVKIFLSTLAQTYDPHSEYMSPSELENFSINMRLSLVGIGAVLNSEDGYAKIMELVPGGPASKDGRIKVGDRVTAVAQGQKAFVDAVDMKLDKVVEMIRGKKDTTVRLQVIPVDAADPSSRKVIDIRRDEIKLKEQEAKAEIIERPLPDGSSQRLGWITLPSFYADMEKSGSPNAKSTTKDVLALLTRLKAEGITGLVMDLRRDGGGSLEEAVNLTGLFIKKGPVVQSKDSNGNINVSRDRDATLAYDGPMIVLTNRLSASASEIFAAALQDYGRALVVGDSNTFGKGTVQTMLEIGRIMPFLGGGNQAGALKLTIQKFYRIAGGSTQLQGVASDIRLPSLFDQPEIGEGSLKAPLPYDEVRKVDFDKWERPLFKNELSKRSEARVAADPEFRYVMEDLDRIKTRISENSVSLNEKTRLMEIEQDKARKQARTAERLALKPVEPKVFAVTLDNVTKPQLELVSLEEKAEAEKQNKSGAAAGASLDPDADPEDETDSKAPAVDAVKNESLNILADMVELARAPKTASTK